MTQRDINFWIFDLDNTLYAPEANLFGQIERRMTRYVMRQLNLPADEADALRHEYWQNHGTTLAGLMRDHGVDPVPYLADVHDIDFSVLSPDPALAAAIAALPGRKIIHTNADRDYAGKVLAARGLSGLFDRIYGIAELGYHPKPDPAPYDLIREQEGYDPARAAMFEDDPRNLAYPQQLGLWTVLVAPDPVQSPFAEARTCDLVSFLKPLAQNNRDGQNKTP